jgi:hypothetical protein
MTQHGVAKPDPAAAEMKRILEVAPVQIHRIWIDPEPMTGAYQHPDAKVRAHYTCRNGETVLATARRADLLDLAEARRRRTATAGAPAARPEPAPAGTLGRLVRIAAVATALVALWAWALTGEPTGRHEAPRAQPGAYVPTWTGPGELTVTVPVRAYGAGKLAEQHCDLARSELLKRGSPEAAWHVRLACGPR